ncbi:MAG: phosphoadenylyl-sulfate reductase [Anaerolineales bacterium]|jgi:phosphoadenosine phosphosulfate reductase|nr:phosphoadenylyl-sulfate reductase [Anaerolineales bacterium]
MIFFSQEEINQLALEMENQPPQQIIAWAVENFSPQIAISSSFQSQSVPLLHMVSQIEPTILVFFLDTGLHFWETLMFREKLQREFGLHIQNLHPDKQWNNFLGRFGRNLYEQDPDLCCFLRKVQPMQKAMTTVRAWISGIRRDQTANRQNAKILELERDGLLKINPLLNWTRQDVQEYARQHNLPSHPLLEKGYRSIGCKPCTRAVQQDEDERAGRWSGKGKTECGLHTEMFKQDGPGKSALLNGFLLTPNQDENNERTDHP